jgi:hypothetical protein
MDRESGIVNSKHESVLRAYLADPERVGWRAYSKIYSNASRHTAETGWSQLMKKREFSKRLAQADEAALERTVEKVALTKQWVIDRLIENANRAMQYEEVVDRGGVGTGEFQYAGQVANRALELLGKQLGMFIDRKEVGAPGDFDRMSDEELRAEIVSQAAELGIAPRKRAH